MEMKRRQPIGIELVRRGVVTEGDIEKALEYQRNHPNKKIGDIINILELCDPRKLLTTIGDILGEKTIYITTEDLNIRPEEYISLDVIKKHKAIPFDIESGKVKVCFTDTSNKKTVETIRLLLINKGLVMDKYITFESNIENIIQSIDSESDSSDINTLRDTTSLVDGIIKGAIEKRASDIHIEPLEDKVRVRYRVDGELITVAELPKEKQVQIIGRLKAISNMHEEKQESQDGRILIYPNFNIRVSSQKNVYGEKFVLRMLKKNNKIKQIYDLGFPGDEKLFNKGFNNRNSIAIVAAPTGEGKTTTLYSIIDHLNNPGINITTIEDPVEIRIPGLNQIEVDSKSTFYGSLRTVLRQDPDIILLGEIRDNETAEIAMQSGQTGHYVLSTIHTIDAIEVITRLRKFGISNYDIASTLATAVSQRLVRRICPKCAKEREFTKEEKDIIHSIEERYDVNYNLEGKKTYTAIGCKECNMTGYYDRIGVFEMLLLNESIKELIVNDASTIDIKKEAMKSGYRPLVVDAIQKVVDGKTTLEEINKKLVIY